MTLDTSQYLTSVDDLVVPRATQKFQISAVIDATRAPDSYTKAAMLALSSPQAGQTANVTDGERGLWRHNGARWVKVEPGMNVRAAVLKTASPPGLFNVGAYSLASVLNALGGSEKVSILRWTSVWANRRRIYPL